MIKIYTAITGNKHPKRSDIDCHGEYNRFTLPVLNAKIYKVLPHLFYPEAEWTIWVDGNIHLVKDPEWFVEQVEKSGKTIGVFPHPNRETIEEEANVCISLGYEPDVVSEQVERHQNTPKSVLARCGLIVRKNTPEQNSLNEKWWAEICRGSYRDQLSFPVVFKDPFYFPQCNLVNNEFYKMK